jgi:hypothetical protein
MSENDGQGNSNDGDNDSATFPRRKPQKATTVPDLIKHFSRQLAFAPTSKARCQNFNKDTFTKCAQEHSNLFAIAKYPVNQDYYSHQNQKNRQFVVNQCATFKENVFFRDPYDGRIFSCCDDAVEKEMERRGFVRIGVVHLLGNKVQLPVLSNSVAELPKGSIESQGAPAEVTLPWNHKFPKLWKCGENTTTAEAVVHAFEVKVVDPATKAIYSPYRLWNQKEREKVQMEKSTNLTKYCQTYFLIRMMKLNPETETRGINELAALATSHAHQNFSEKPDWFKEAVKVYEMQ